MFLKWNTRNQWYNHRPERLWIWFHVLPLHVINASKTIKLLCSGWIMRSLVTLTSWNKIGDKNLDVKKTNYFTPQLLLANNSFTSRAQKRYSRTLKFQNWTYLNSADNSGVYARVPNNVFHDGWHAVLLLTAQWILFLICS